MTANPSGKQQPRLGYVTDLARTPAGGGSYAVNWHGYEELSRCFNMRYYGPIVPRRPILQDIISKFNRYFLKRPGRFVYFSEATLNSNARTVESHIENDIDGIVFRSAARWCRVKPKIPYYVYLDAVFHTFFYNTFDESEFVRSDLERIFEEEAQFLEGAAAVFFESSWGMQKAREAYSLKGAHYLNVGRGGVVSPPEKDSWDGQSYNLVTMAMNFSQKGGEVVLEAYRILKARFPSLMWHIIGGEPTPECKQLEGVIYEGFLNPDNQRQRSRLETILQNAFLLLHPTREDVSPLVITEAGYFGCPAISINAFGIPELVTHGVTGILLNSATAHELATSVAELLENEQRYRGMRVNAREKALSRFRWDKVGALMCDRISLTIGE